jgi:hypothetical protein
VQLADVQAPAHTVKPFRGPEDTIALMGQMVKGPRGEQSITVYRATEHVVRGLQPKDYLSEILAIRYWVAEKIRYKNDPLAMETVSDPERLITEIAKYGRATADCFPAGTLTLAKGHRLIPVEELLVGDQIWGQDDWSTVEGVVYKGMLEVDALHLNNGSTLLLTPDHHVYRMACAAHEHREAAAESRCHVGLDQRREERVRVSELRERDVLTTPERIPFGEEAEDPDRAYIEGLYLSDGWCQPDNYSFSISGQDGCPKEEQKREVQLACERLGVPTTWYRKSINVRSSEWARRLHLMGTHAPEKHLLSLDLGEAAAAATLRGIMADSGANTHGNGRTFTSTSRLLAIQTRLLHKMFGVTCGRSFIENHGGLGLNPIWRLYVRGGRTDESHERLLRVRRIDRAVAVLPVWDIQTSDHRVYLPEHDVTVSQCDDVASLMATMMRQVGREAQFVTVGFGRPGKFSHVFTRVKEPKSGRWIVCDPVAGLSESSMLSRVATWRAWRI